MSLHEVHVSNILPGQEQGVYNVNSHHLLLGLTLTLHLPNQLDKKYYQLSELVLNNNKYCKQCSEFLGNV